MIVITKFKVEFFRQWIRVPARQVPALGPEPSPIIVEAVNFGTETAPSFGYRFMWTGEPLRSCGAPSSCATNEGGCVWSNQFGSLRERTREEIIEYCGSAARDFLRANGWSVKKWEQT
jgi:hypothetical protein